jgi:hypothetical protein
LAIQLGDSHRHRIERLVTALIWESNARSSGTHEMAVQFNVDRAFNSGILNRSVQSALSNLHVLPYFGAQRLGLACLRDLITRWWLAWGTE